MVNSLLRNTFNLFLLEGKYFYDRGKWHCYPWSFIQETAHVTLVRIEYSINFTKDLYKEYFD